MNIEFVGRHYDLDHRIREFTQDKLKKVIKFLEEPIDVRVTLELEKHRHIADLHISHRHGVLQATDETSDMYDAVNLTMDKVGKQARRSKRKSVDKRRRAGNGNRWPLEILERASLATGASPRIIKTTHLSIKPMTIEEAALRLDHSKNDFVVFRDSSTDRVSVLYKRKDSNYGLIAPEF
jgi:putative sigma-54 modulation protein